MLLCELLVQPRMSPVEGYIRVSQARERQRGREKAFLVGGVE